MGTCRLAQLRREAGYTQQSLVAEIIREARRLGIAASATVRTVRRWEREVPPPLPHPGQQAVLEAIFGLPPAEMGFDVPTHRGQHVSPILSDDEDVQRRKFVTGSGGVAAAALLPELPGPRVGTADVQRFRAGLAELYRIDHARGSVPALAQAGRLQEEINRGLGQGSYTARVGTELQTLLAQLHGHRAWFSYDAGRIDEGRAHCMEALTVAQFADDPMLQVRVLGSFVLLALKAHRVWEAASAAQHASVLARRAGAGATVHLVIALREANVTTQAGDLSGARRALSRAVSFQGRADQDDAVPAWAKFAGPVEIDYATADMYLRAGQPARAVPFLRSATSGINGDYARNSATYRAKLAGVLLAAGEVEEACNEMNAVFGASMGISSPRLLQKVQAFRQKAKHIDSAAVRDCTMRINEMMRAG